MKVTGLTFPVFIIMLAGQLSDFWLHPGKFIFKQGETINIRFLHGTAFEGQKWNGGKMGIEKMFFYWADTKDSCNQHVTGDIFSISLHDAGTAMLTFQSKPAVIETPAADFQKQLRDNEQLTALDIRKENNQEQARGKELVHHFAKTIIQVGNNTDKTYKKETGFPVEIIPGDNPYTLTKDGNFKVSVWFMDKPLENHPVKVWHKLGEKVTTHHLKTDEDGTVNFFISALGEWMVSASVMEPLQNHAKADWETFKGTLTWGYTK